LKAQGANKGDRVIIYMPMIPEAVIAMLACARIGAIHSVVFGGFASNELASRIDDSKAKILVTASCGFEPGRTVEYKPLVDEAIKIANHKIEKMILFQRPGNEVKLVCLYFIYLRYNWNSKRDSKRYWWSHCCSQMDYEKYLQH